MLLRLFVSTVPADGPEVAWRHGTSAARRHKSAFMRNAAHPLQAPNALLQIQQPLFEFILRLIWIHADRTTARQDRRFKSPIHIRSIMRSVPDPIERGPAFFHCFGLIYAALFDAK